MIPTPEALKPFLSRENSRKPPTTKETWPKVVHSANSQPQHTGSDNWNGTEKTEPRTLGANPGIPDQRGGWLFVVQNPESTQEIMSSAVNLVFCPVLSPGSSQIWAGSTEQPWRMDLEKIHPKKFDANENHRNANKSVRLSWQKSETKQSEYFPAVSASARPHKQIDCLVAGIHPCYVS